jgi:hypothetical protein
VAAGSPATCQWLERTQLKVPAGRLAAVLAALLALVLVVAGCGPSASPGPAAPSSTLVATAAARPQPGRVQLGDADAYVAVATRDP